MRMLPGPASCNAGRSRTPGRENWSLWRRTREQGCRGSSGPSGTTLENPNPMTLSGLDTERREREIERGFKPSVWFARFNGWLEGSEGCLANMSGECRLKKKCGHLIS